MEKNASYFIISEEYLVSNISYAIFSTVCNDKKTLIIDAKLPFFYIKEDDYKKNNPIIEKIFQNYQYNLVKTEKKNFQDETLLKIYLNSPKEVPKLRNELFDEGVLSFESDIRYTQRFKMDYNLFAFINPKDYFLFSKKSVLSDYENRLNEKLKITEKIISKNSDFKETEDSFEFFKKEIFRNYASYYDEIIFLPNYDENIDYSRNYFDILSLDIETIEDSIIMISAIYSKVNMDNSIDDSISYSYILQNPINSFKKENLKLSKDVLDFKNYKIIDTKAKYFDSEKDMLINFFEDIKTHNPDFITGWNVIDFDLAFLKKVSTKYEIPFELSRKKEESSLILYSDFLKTSKANFFGRIVLDGIDLLKENFVKLENYKLDTASKEILKNQKIEIENEKLGKYESIIKQWQEGSNKLIEYNLKDSGLVLDILTEIKLITLIIHRSQITGLVVDRVNSAIQALDSLYVRKANQNNIICNNVNSNSSEIGVEGAYVLNPKKGIYDNVCVFDFKSLYPSIILTYNVDPYSFSGTINQPKVELSKPVEKFRKSLIDYFKIKNSDDEIIKVLNDEKSYKTNFKFYFDYKNEKYIISPNGTFFSQKKSLLKDLIKNVWNLRDIAKKEKDDVKSFALKITMNSFAGSLGNANCRIHNSKVMSAITGFGRLSIKILKQYLEENKIKVLYGDTDSVFVLSNKNKYLEVKEFGNSYEKYSNDFNTKRIKEQYDLDSKLYLEFEKVYSKFLLLGVKKRYAGMKIIPSNDNEIKKELEVVGMEIVRSDWTDIAKRVQQNVLNLIFNERDVKSYLSKIIKDLYDKKLDNELVYRKKIRKSLEEYVKTTPPHVKAARQLDKLESNIIEYVITVDGPQPIQKLTSKIDYEHYIDKQIKGAIDSILSALGLNFDDIINKSEQKNLFDF